MKTMQKDKPDLASIRECTGCMSCADACRQEAIKMQIHDDGHIYPIVDSEKCISCGACEKVCPIQNKMPYSSNLCRSNPFAAWCTDEEMILKTASGGIFAAIAKYILSIGGYVVGATSVGEKVKHIVISSLHDLHLLQGSKYLQSNTTGIYHDVKKLLLDGKTVLFSGTGCQVAALLQFLGKKYECLYTIDLICAGVPSSLVMSRFCKEEGIQPEQIRWRDKENGWQHGLQLSIMHNGLIDKYKTQNCFFWGGFLGGLTSRWSCYNCHFAGTDRMSDITIGDYWGCPDWKEQWFNGVSVMIVHSEAGKKLTELSEITVKPTTWNDCVKGNPRIVLGERPLRGLLIERRYLSWAFTNLSYKTLKKIYAGNINKKDLLWLPYKLFKRLRWMVASRISSKRVFRVLKNN